MVSPLIPLVNTKEQARLVRGVWERGLNRVVTLRPQPAALLAPSDSNGELAL